MNELKNLRLPVRINKMGNNICFTVKKDIAKSLKMEVGQTWLINLEVKLSDGDAPAS